MITMRIVEAIGLLMKAVFQNNSVESLDLESLKLNVGYILLESDLERYGADDFLDLRPNHLQSQLEHRVDP